MTQNKKKCVNVVHLRCGIYTDDVCKILRDNEILYSLAGYKGSIWVRVRIGMFSSNNYSYFIAQENVLGEKVAEISKELVTMFSVFEVEVKQ